MVAPTDDRPPIVEGLRGDRIGLGSPTGHAAPIFRDVFAQGLTLLRVDAEREGDEELHLCKLRRAVELA